MSDVLTDENISVETEKKTSGYDEGDHDLFAHYVEARLLTDAIVNGTPVIALCGKKWIPHRNPDNFPTCPECQEAWKSLPEG